MDDITLSEIHEQYFPQVYRYIYFRLGDTELSESLSSQVFINLVKALQIQPGILDRLRDWLYTTANELTNTVLRSRKGNRRSLELKSGVGGNPARPNKSTDQFAWLGMIIHQSLWQLSLEQQHVLALRFVGGFTPEEITSICGRTVVEIRDSQYDALELMRQYLEEVS